MLNSKSFSRYLRPMTLGCITYVLLAVTGCSATETSEIVSPAPSPVTAEKPSASIQKPTNDTSKNDTSETVVAEKPDPRPPANEVPAQPADDAPAKMEPRQEIPEPFQGEWNANLNQCGSQASEGRLAIAPQQIQFYESGGPVKEIVSDGQRTLTGTMELSGEGETWVDQLNFQLSEDQKALTHVIDDSTTFVRYRCP